MSLLELNNINLTYGIDVKSQILSNIDLSIEAGEFVSIMGPSGSGKSTLLYVMSGLERPDTGSVMIDGKDLSKLDDNTMADFRLENLGFIYQFFNLVPVLNVEENIVLPLKIAKKNIADYKSKIDEIIIDIGLNDKRYHKISQLSGGQQQRVAIARALINNPKIIYADEPTGSLDEKNALEIMELLKRLSIKNETTIIMVTHNVDMCRYSTRIVNIRDGRIE